MWAWSRGERLTGKPEVCNLDFRNLLETFDSAFLFVVLRHSTGSGLSRRSPLSLNCDVASLDGF